MIPKSSVVSTRPVPNSSYHMRFTVTRAVRGFSGLTVHFASARRFRGSFGGKGERKCSVLALTHSVRAVYTPRVSTCAYGRVDFSQETNVNLPPADKWSNRPSRDTISR